jgi:sulfoxide reductase heme-binding subunit YedZ
MTTARTKPAAQFAPLFHLVHLALVPLIVLVADFALGRLSVNPIQDLTQRTGFAAIILLVLSLACTPLAYLTGYKKLLTLRRPLGLYAFLYVALHMLVFVALDFGFALDLIQREIAEKPYILLGSLALIILTLLALTSTRRAQRALGKNWKRLHQLVYIAAPLALVHYAWSQKADITLPLVLGAVVVVLLVLRLPAVRRRFARHP